VSITMTNKQTILRALAAAGRELRFASERQRKNLGLTPEMVKVLIDLHRQDEEKKRQARETAAWPM